MFSIYKNVSSALEIIQNCPLPEAAELLKIFHSHYEDNGINFATCKNRSPFIVLEGLDGAGKTTVRNELIAVLDGVTRQTPPHAISHLRSMFDKQPTALRRAFYALGNYIAGREAERLTMQGMTVVMDRFWHSTAAYTIGQEVDMKLENLPLPEDDIYEWPRDLTKPDVVLYLSINEKNRIARTAGRGQEITVEEDQLMKDGQFRETIETAYKRMTDPRPHIVDSNGSIPDVVQQCLEIIATKWPSLHTIK